MTIKIDGYGVTSAIICDECGNIVDRLYELDEGPKCDDCIKKDLKTLTLDEVYALLSACGIIKDVTAREIENTIFFE